MNNISSRSALNASYIRGGFSEQLNFLLDKSGWSFEVKKSNDRKIRNVFVLHIKEEKDRKTDICDLLTQFLVKEIKLDATSEIDQILICSPAQVACIWRRKY